METTVFSGQIETLISPLANRISANGTPYPGRHQAIASAAHQVASSPSSRAEPADRLAPLTLFTGLSGPRCLFHVLMGVVSRVWCAGRHWGACWARRTGSTKSRWPPRGSADAWRERSGCRGSREKRGTASSWSHFLFITLMKGKNKLPESTSE